MQVKGQSAFRLNWKVITLLVSLLCVFIEEAKGMLTCQYEVLADTSVDDNYRVADSYGISQSACEQLCTDRLGCSFAVYLDPTCYLYDEKLLTPQSDSGWTYMKKLSCSSDATTQVATTTTSTTAEPTTTTLLPTTTTQPPTTTTAQPPTTTTTVTSTTTTTTTTAPATTTALTSTTSSDATTQVATTTTSTTAEPTTTTLLPTTTTQPPTTTTAQPPTTTTTTVTSTTTTTTAPAATTASTSTTSSENTTPTTRTFECSSPIIITTDETTLTTTQPLTSSSTVTSTSPPPPTTTATIATTAQTTTPSTTAPTTTTLTSTTPSDLRMVRKVNTSSTVAPVYMIESVGQCEEACTLVLQCMAYTLNSTSTTCTLYNATRYHNGSNVRVKCRGFTEISNMAGDDSMSLSYSATLESCESVCLRSRVCQAVVFNSDALTCSLYLSIPTHKDDDPSLTLSWKISDEGEVFTFTSENDGHNGLTRLSSTLHMCVLPLLSGLLASLLLACH